MSTDQPTDQEAPDLGKILEQGEVISPEKVLADNIRKLEDPDIVNLYKLAQVALKLKHDQAAAMIKDIDADREVHFVAQKTLEMEWKKLAELEKPEEAG